LWKSCFLFWHYKFILAKTAEFLRYEKDISHSEELRYISESQDHHAMGKKSLQEM
jgi:hypothetical protein